MENSTLTQNNSMVPASEDALFNDRVYAYKVALNSIELLICVIGILLNYSLVYITVKHSILHKVSNYLLAICSFYDALTETSIFFTIVLLFMRTKIPLLSCFYMQLYADTAAINAILNFFFISVDRLVAVAFPAQYRKLVKKGKGRLVAVLNSFSMALALSNMFVAWRFALEHHNMMVFCVPGEVFKGGARTFVNRLGVVSTLLAFFDYFLIWLLLKVAKPDRERRNAGEAARSLFKSLVVIMVAIFCCYLIIGIGHVLFMSLANSGWSTHFVVKQLFSQMAIIATAINAPVLYFCSSQYREIMQNEFWLVRALSEHLHGARRPNSLGLREIAPNEQQRTDNKTLETTTTEPSTAVMEVETSFYI